MLRADAYVSDIKLNYIIMHIYARICIYIQKYNMQV